MAAVQIGVVGPGLVGSAFIRMLLEQAGRLQQVLGVSSIQLTGLANSRKQFFQPEGISAGTWKEELQVDLEGRGRT